MDVRPYRIAGVKRVIAILEAAKVEVELAGGVPDPPNQDSPSGLDIFIVHGRDDAAKHEVARFLAAEEGGSVQRARLCR